MPGDGAQRAQVFGGIVLAWALSAGFVVAGWRASDISMGSTAAEAVGFAALLAGATQLAGVGWAARLRFFVSNIDGAPPEPGSALDITLRYVSNTTEQVVLFVLGCLALAAIDGAVAIRLLPVMAVWFVIARALFFAGYRVGPVWRALGFAATFHPTVVLYAYVLMRFFG